MAMPLVNQQPGMQRPVYNLSSWPTANAGQQQQQAQWNNAPVTASGKGSRGSSPQYGGPGSQPFTPPPDRSGIIPVVRRPPFQAPVITNPTPPPIDPRIEQETATNRNRDRQNEGGNDAPGADAGGATTGMGSDTGEGASGEGFRYGGTVKKTGPSKVHKGEEVITKQEASKPGVRGALKDINKPGVGPVEKQIKKVRPFNR